METRGYETINDRSAGWGPGVDVNLQPDADAAVEATGTRLGKQLKEREYIEYDASVSGEFVDYEGELEGDAIVRTTGDPIVSGNNRPTDRWQWTKPGGSPAWNDRGISEPGEVTPDSNYPAAGTKDERGDASVELPE